MDQLENDALKNADALDAGQWRLDEAAPPLWSAGDHAGDEDPRGQLDRLDAGAWGSAQSTPPMPLDGLSDQAAMCAELESGETNAKDELFDLPHLVDQAVLKTDPAEIPHLTDPPVLKAEISEILHPSDQAIPKPEIPEIPRPSDQAIPKTEPSAIPHPTSQAVLKSEILEDGAVAEETPKPSRPTSRSSARRSTAPSRTRGARKGGQPDVLLDATMQQAIASALAVLLKQSATASNGAAPKAEVPSDIVVSGASQKQAEKVRT